MENQELSLENTLTESMMTDNVAAQSTPMTTRVKELSMDDMFNLIRTMSENINRNLNAKSEEQKSDSNVKYDKIDAKFDKQSSDCNEKFDEIRNEIKQQNFMFSDVNC